MSDKEADKNERRATSSVLSGSLLFGAFAAILALSIVLFGSDLFRTLGFEYSALAGLYLSLLLGLFGATNGAKYNKIGNALTGLVASAFVIATIPLLVSSLSLIVIPNCSFWDGIVFYIEVAYPSALLGLVFGIASSFLFRSSRWAKFAYVAFWIATLVVSLLPGYTNPQLFTYGWQYGFFPGFIWDEALELTNAYLWFRVENALVAIAVISFVAAVASPTMRPRLSAIYRKREGGGTPPLQILVLAVSSLALVVIHFYYDDLRITSSHERVETFLDRSLPVEVHCKVLYRHGSLTEEQTNTLRDDLRWYLHDIRERYGLKDTSREIRIYVYPNVDALYEYVGTRSASIAKPWLSELHIAKANLASLKHELTHVLLREAGSFPFYASWSTGLTEGAAMALDPNGDGLYTLDEHAAQILQMKYAEGVGGVMSFTGFASNASSKSYTLAGSFSRFLIAKYGAPRFMQVYRSVSFDNAYGKPLSDLEREWKSWLGQYQHSLDASDSLRLRYYYDRSSILFQPCLRRIGKLTRRATEAARREHFVAADSIYALILSEGGGTGALRGRVDALLKLGKVSEARKLLDTSRAGDVVKQKIGLSLLAGMVDVLGGDRGSAKLNFDRALSAKLSDNFFASAYIFRYLLDIPDSAQVNKYFASLNRHWSPVQQDSLLNTLAKIVERDTATQGVVIANYLKVSKYLSRGEEHRAKDSLNIDALSAFAYNARNSNDSLFAAICYLQAADLGVDVDIAAIPVKYRNYAREWLNELAARRRFLTSGRSATLETHR